MVGNALNLMYVLVQVALLENSVRKTLMSVKKRIPAIICAIILMDPSIASARRALSCIKTMRVVKELVGHS